jgi:hypothetical protein
MRRLPALLAVVAGCIARPTIPTAQKTVGIADQTGDTFTDQLFTDLGIKHARLNLAWDAFQYPWQVDELDHWMTKAKAAGVRPLVIFSQSRVPKRTRLLPTLAQYRRMVQAMRRRYPWVREYAGWNEMNFPGQPTFKKPQAVAQFYKVLRQSCPGCTVLPGSLLDNPNIVRWTKSLQLAIRKARQPEPKVWGLHNYNDVNQLRDRTTAQLLKAVKGRLWLTETGGIVSATSPTASGYPQGEAWAGRVTSYVLDTLVKRHPRIERAYIYEWKAPKGDVSWDSGLVTPTDKPRPAYKVIQKFLQKPPGR